MRFVSKSSTPRISKLNDAIHANLKKLSRAVYFDWDRQSAAVNRASSR